MGGLHTGKLLPQTQISRMVCDEGLFGYENKNLSDPLIRTSPLGKPV